METIEQNSAVADEVHYCEVHPDRETSLRCNKCGRYMCVQCAVQTPVGYRCRQCVRQHEDKFYQGTNYDYLIVFAACAILGGIGAYISRFIGFFLFVLIAAVPIGGVISEVALRLTKRRRGRYSGHVGAVGVVVGGLGLAGYFIYQQMALFNQTPELVGMVGPEYFIGQQLPLLIYTGITAVIVYGRFKM